MSRNVGLKFFDAEDLADDDVLEVVASCGVPPGGFVVGVNEGLGLLFGVLDLIDVVQAVGDRLDVHPLHLTEGVLVDDEAVRGGHAFRVGLLTGQLLLDLLGIAHRAGVERVHVKSKLCIAC